MKKALVILNEKLDEMGLGTNTSLSYILGAVENGFAVYLWNLADNPPSRHCEQSEAIHTKLIEKESAELAIAEFKKTNKKISDFVKNGDFAGLMNLKIKKADIKFSEETIAASEIDLVIQRLEPMKKPFPPQGNFAVDDVLRKIKNIFPNHKFNCPIGLKDKDLQEFEGIAIPTIEFEIDQKGSDPFLPKSVVKPKNSAQSLGVFAVEISETGLELSTLQLKKVNDLNSQIYKIKGSDPFYHLIEILCAVQSARIKGLGNILVRDLDIIATAKELYNEKVLIQPFLEGVKLGDVRVCILKNQNGDFYLAGNVFRKSIKSSNETFTTAYSTGSSCPHPTSSLTREEQKDLQQKTEKILTILNGKLREKYRDVTELGADFILVGNAKELLLSEINHLCPGLLPVAEAIEHTIDEKAIYDRGLGLAKKAIYSL